MTERTTVEISCAEYTGPLGRIKELRIRAPLGVLVTGLAVALAKRGLRVLARVVGMVIGFLP